MVNAYGFKPMLFPNESVLARDVRFPQLASVKLDGIRCIFIEGDMLSRSFKPINNLVLLDRFKPLMKLTKEFDIILDGELYGHGINFPELSGKIRAKDATVPKEVKFNCFDCVSEGDFNMKAIERYELLINVAKTYGFESFNVVEQLYIKHVDALEDLFAKALKDGYEGLILKSPTSVYKCGRVSAKSGNGYKFKPYMTFDAQIIGVEQATRVLDDVERTKDAFGHSVTSMKKADREFINMASAFLVMWEGKEMKVTLAMKEEEKIDVWNNRNFYEGKWIEFKGMKVGMKDVPRHPIFIRFRPDKD